MIASATHTILICNCTVIIFLYNVHRVTSIIAQNAIFASSIILDSTINRLSKSFISLVVKVVVNANFDVEKSFSYR